MALLKTGVRYPLSIISSFTYKCANKNCTYCSTAMEDEKVETKCPFCGGELEMISSNTEVKSKES